MAYWLMKSEPDAFSWEQQVENGVEPWTGVRSHQAKKNLQGMRVGDRSFFYHSNIGKEIVGIVEVVREAYPDPSAETGGWVCVDCEGGRADAAPSHPGGDQGRRRVPRFPAGQAVKIVGCPGIRGALEADLRTRRLARLSSRQAQGAPSMLWARTASPPFIGCPPNVV